MAHITAEPRRRHFAPWLIALLGVGLLLLLPLLSAGLPHGEHVNAPAAAPASGSRIAYFQFNRQADTLWLADPAHPDQRVGGFSVSHAPDYGIVPSLAPDGHRLVYNVLPPDTPIPGPDAAAQLWLADARSSDPPALLAKDVDLLVPAVWSSDGSSVVFRRSGANADDTYELASVPTTGGSETTLVTSKTDALFPIGYSADGARFYFVRLNDTGSFLASVDTATGAETQIAQLADGLTRDWSLSPDRGRLAYLSIDGSDASNVASSAEVLDIASGAVQPVGDAGDDAFSPRWDANGNLVLGQLASGAASTAAQIIGSNSTTALTAPSKGFDVPLAIDAGGSIAVRSFDGASATNPGRAVLTVIDGAGARHQIASGEVTFLGWINP